MKYLAGVSALLIALSGCGAAKKLILFESPQQLYNHVDSLANESYSNLEDRLQEFFGEDFKLPSLVVMRADYKQDPFGATYDRRRNKIVIFGGSYVWLDEVVEFYNKAPFTEDFWNLRIKDHIVHETVHAYFSFLTEKYGVGFWRYGKRAEKESVKKLWKTAVEGIVMVVTEGFMEYRPDLGDFPENILTLTTQERYKYWNDFPYIAGRELFHDLYQQYGLSLMDVVAQNPPKEEEWLDLPAYQERIREQMKNRRNNSHNHTIQWK